MIIAGAAGVMASNIFSKVMYYVFYLILIGVIGVVGWFVYYWISWKITLHYWPVTGSGTSKHYAVGNMKTTMLKWNPKKTAWKIKHPLFNKKEIEPFNSDYEFPNKTYYAFKVGDEYIPAVIDYEHQRLASVPHAIRNWQAMTHKKLAIELSERSFWEENKYFFMVVITAAICLAAVCLTVYYTYEFVKPAQASMDALSKAIKGITNIGGVAPG